MVLTVFGSVVFCLLVWTAGQVMDLYGGNTTMRAARSGQLLKRYVSLSSAPYGAPDWYCVPQCVGINSNSLKLELVYYDYTWQWRLCPISSL